MEWPRLWLTVGLAALCIAVAGLLYLGWKRRAGRQSGFVELPPVPVARGAELAPALDGVYVSTTSAGHWQDRIVVQTLGRRAKASTHLYAAGVLVDRVAESPIWIPKGALVSIGTAPGVAGKVMGLPDGILLITWNWGDTPVDTGVRATDPAAQARWITAAAELFTPHTGATA